MKSTRYRGVAYTHTYYHYNHNHNHISTFIQCSIEFLNKTNDDVARCCLLWLCWLRIPIIQRYNYDLLLVDFSNNEHFSPWLSPEMHICILFLFFLFNLIVNHVAYCTLDVVILALMSSSSFTWIFISPFCVDQFNRRRF